MIDRLGNEIESIDGIDVTFVKQHVSVEEARAEAAYHTPDISDDDLAKIREYWTYGWKANIGKDQYGDWIKLTDAVFTEAHDVLVDQFREVVKALNKQ